MQANARRRLVIEAAIIVRAWTTRTRVVGLLIDTAIAGVRLVSALTARAPTSESSVVRWTSAVTRPASSRASGRTIWLAAR